MAATASLRRPPLPLLLGGGLLAAMLVLVLATRNPDMGDADAGMPTPSARVVAQKTLRFLDQPDGSIRVTDAQTGRTVGAIEGESGFARGSLRSLARERRRTGHDASAPFVLLARADGGLVLSDPATGQHIDLGSFGPTNAGVFARLLNSNGETP